MTPSAEPSTQPAAQAESAASAPRPPRLALLIATGFGSGYLPKAPGTAGSLLGVALTWALWMFVYDPSVRRAVLLPPELFFYFFLALTLVLALVGIPAAGRVATYLNAKDPQVVVIDEVSGQALALLGVALPMFLEVEVLEWQYLLAGFILFRVFDIWKPWPVRAAERLPGGWGIMADDWVAGIYAALCLWALRVAGL
jgi:phosphatidylglycerophosphatase A